MEEIRRALEKTQCAAARKCSDHHQVKPKRYRSAIGQWRQRLDEPGRKTQLYAVTKTITKIGNSQGLMFDAAFMDLARMKVGDRVNLTVHEGGSIVLTPVRSVIGPAKAAATARRLTKKNAELFRRLS